MRTALAALLVALALPVAPAHAACDVTVQFAGYNPASHSVAPGTNVTWCWNESNHSVTGTGFDSGVQDSGHMFSHTFASAGTFAYHCTRHGNMVGSIVVGSGSPSPTKPAPTMTAPEPVATTTRPPTRAPSHPATASPTPSRTATPATAAATTTPPAVATSQPATTAPAPAPSETALAGEPAAHRGRGLPIGVAIAAVAALGGLGAVLRTRRAAATGE